MEFVVTNYNTIVFKIISGILLIEMIIVLHLPILEDMSLNMSPHCIMLLNLLCSLQLIDHSREQD